LSVANAIEEEVNDGKVACDIWEKRYKVKGLNTHKAVHKNITNKC